MMHDRLSHMKDVGVWGLLTQLGLFFIFYYFLFFIPLFPQMLGKQ